MSSYAAPLDSCSLAVVSNECADSISTASNSTASIYAMDGLPKAASGADASRGGLKAGPRRRVSRQAGRAIEMLGHAIEYLADEFALECRAREMDAARKHGCVQAIELLMVRNREIYLSCPVVPSMAERLRAFLHLQRA